jgi:hypothetical protein
MTRLRLKMVLILAPDCRPTLSESHSFESRISQFKVLIINIMIIGKYSLSNKGADL